MKHDEGRCSAATKRRGGGAQCAQAINLRRVGRRWLCAVHDPQRRATNLASLERATAASVKSRTRGDDALLADWPLEGGRIPATAADALKLSGWTAKQLVA